MIIQETADLLESLYGKTLQRIRIERIVVGVYFTGVKLTNGCGGVSYTPTAELHGSCCSILNTMGRKRGALKGAIVHDILQSSPVSPLTTVVKIVVMNALSSFFLSDRRYHIVYDTDVLDLLEIGEKEKIGMVGAFAPFIQRLKHLPGIDLSVIERKDGEGLFGPDEVKFHVPAELAEDILPGCTTVIITGASIANGTLAGLLGLVRPDARLVVTGPTSSFLPDALFRRNVSVVGASIVTDADLALDMLSEGAGAHQLFGVCLRKINFLRDNFQEAVGEA